MLSPVFFLIIGIVISAALVYYAERIQYNPDNDFTSIPVGPETVTTTTTHHVDFQGGPSIPSDVFVLN